MERMHPVEPVPQLRDTDQRPHRDQPSQPCRGVPVEVLCSSTALSAAVSVIDTGRLLTFCVIHFFHRTAYVNNGSELALAENGHRRLRLAGAGRAGSAPHPGAGNHRGVHHGAELLGNRHLSFRRGAADAQEETSRT